jgi:hypothetical protein
MDFAAALTSDGPAKPGRQVMLLSSFVAFNLQVPTALS